MFNKALVLALTLACLCGAASFTATHGKLRVQGGKILNASGNEVVLRGMSLYWYQGPWGGGQPGDQFYSSGTVSSLANNWNANVVRAAIGNVHQNYNSAMSMAMNMIDWAWNAGVYIIIDNHSHVAHRPNLMGAAENFFWNLPQYVAQKGYTHVIYEIYNEPICDIDKPKSEDHNCTGASSRTSWEQIKEYAERIVWLIRQNDPDNLIVVGTPSYSSQISRARNNPLTGDLAHNVLYALHFYAGSPGHDDYRNDVKTAYCSGFPVFASEWGTSLASGGGTISTSNSNTWISLLEAAKISWANWSVSVGESSAALTSNNVDGSTSASGTYVKNLLRLNTGASLSSVGLSEQTIDCGSPISIKSPAGNSGLWSFDAASNAFVFESGDGTLSIYNLAGEKKAMHAAQQGRISVNALPPGAYIAVYKQGSQTLRKTIYLK